MITTPDLELVEEQKLARLLGDLEPSRRLEASGVCFQGGFSFVVFDNSRRVARIGLQPLSVTPEAMIILPVGRARGFEGIAFDPERRHYFLLVESSNVGPGVFKALVEEYDEDFRLLDNQELDFVLPAENKGFEGIAHMRRAEGEYLLCLCEGNKCRGGKKGRKPGKGRIQLFQRDDGRWKHTQEIKLPKVAFFNDYADLCIADRRVAVVSQHSASLWVGRFQDDGWDFVDDGKVYRFPGGAQGKTAYCNIEGVAWVGDDRLVAVSDRWDAAKHTKECRATSESIHVFRLPVSA